MKTWPVQDAKARFSEMLDACTALGPQVVTKRGIETAVLVPAAEWYRMQQRAKPTLKELLLSPTARGDLAIPRRGKHSRRPAPNL
ncbi:prevent-host-death family protein [Hephaestia caeni]|uniref:Antitoxin n=1 Tax=Hephaestia caeni TaxID=645617 RepID=A0A397PKL8_9SPHN|nr:type II toxin-antitoxin system Phd/YefM family antitoxin [Hephaestia caeni]RIA46221.1 prevent-host-death family protein [Hephaestia caeni]